MHNTRSIAFFVPPELHAPLPYIPLLYPFWGVKRDDHAPLNALLFATYQFDKSQYHLVDMPSQADFFLMPYRYAVVYKNDRTLFKKYLAAARVAHKPLFVDGTDDVDYLIHEPDVYVLRIGGYRFSDSPNDIVIPPYADDLLERFCGGALSPRQKPGVPTVGFAGWASLSSLQYLRSFVKEIPIRVLGLFNSRYRACKKGVFFRARAVDVLAGSDAVRTNFLVRTSYSANMKTAEKDVTVLRKEFVDNILGSDYVLDVRGDANESTRLYEALSLGRIPIIVDTERHLPFREQIRYEDFSLIVDFRDLDHLPQMVRAFHDSLSPEEFLAMQERARAVYRTYFRIDVLTTHIMDRLHAILAEQRV